MDRFNLLGIEGWYKYVPTKQLGERCVLNFDQNNIGTIWLIVAGIADALLRVGAMVAVVFFIIGAFKLVTSQGSPEGVKSGRGTMINALIGLVITIVATWLVSFFMRYLFGASL